MGVGVRANVDGSGCDEMNAGDISLVFFSTVFVLLQTPAMGLAQAGLLRRKNSLSTIMQILTNFVLGSILWWLFCFSLVFGPSGGGFIGNPFTYALFLDVPEDECMPHQTGATSIPGLLFAAFQLSFFVMAPVIISGSWAEKMTFEAFLIFVINFSIFVYCPQAHWIWNEFGFLAQLGVLDYSGGIVIHTSVGVAGLIVALFLYKRRKQGNLQPHSIPVFVLGASLIWIGWYSFNAGSAYHANGQAVRALMNTHMSACAGALVFVILARLRDGKWHLLEIMNGALAGLAAITAGSGYVEPWASVIIGSICGALSFLSIAVIRNHFLLDDVLDVSSLQGTPGIVGSILVGVFAEGDGLIYSGKFDQIGYQIAGVASIVAWTSAWTWVLLILVRKTVGSDVSLLSEELGLDVTQMGEKAYDTDVAIIDNIGPEVLATRMLDAAAAGDLREIKALVQGGADPTVLKDYDGRTSLHLAAAEGRLPVVRYLLHQHDPEVNARDRWGLTPLHEAIRHRRADILNSLLGHGAVLYPPATLEEVMYACVQKKKEDIQWFARGHLAFNELKDYDFRTPLHVSISEGDEEISKILLKGGCSLDACDRWNRTPRDYDLKGILPSIQSVDSEWEFVEEPEGDVVQPTRSGFMMFDSLAGVTDKSVDLSEDSTTLRRVHDLCSATFSGDIEEVRLCLKKGANPNSFDYDGRTPLHIAAASGHIHIVKLLLEQKDIQVQIQDRNKSTPLSEAISHNQPQIASLLRKAGAVMTGASMGFKLANAAAKNDLDTLKSMHKSGVDLNLGDYDQRTALHLAAAEGRYETVRWLLLMGANPNAKDRFGNTPKDEAVRKGEAPIINLFGGKELRSYYEDRGKSAPALIMSVNSDPHEQQQQYSPTPKFL